MIGIPAITGVSLGSLRLSSDNWLERLLMAGLGLGLALNGLAGWTLRQRRQRRACRSWMVLHGTILTVAVLAYWDWIHFDWLRRALQGAGRLAGDREASEVARGLIQTIAFQASRARMPQ